jgi:hypothetical protein
MLPVLLAVVPLSGTLVVTATTVLVLVLTTAVEPPVVVALRPLEYAAQSAAPTEMADRRSAGLQAC